MHRPCHPPSYLAAGLALLPALLAPLALADQELRAVTWKLETVGTPGNALGRAAGLLRRIVGGQSRDQILRQPEPRILQAPQGAFGRVNQAATPGQYHDRRRTQDGEV
jgi:hypothetical protein